MTIDIKDIEKKLKKVDDPEIGISIVDMGLIYEIKEKNGVVSIKMTLTSVGCPMFPMIEENIIDEVKKIKGVKKVKVKVVFNPPWTINRMTKKLQKKFGF